MIRQNIEEVIKNALTGMGAEDAAFVVERPGSMEHGDFSTNAALAAAKVLKKNPKEVAEELTAKLLSQNIEGIEKIEVAGAGFINFFVSRSALAKEVETSAMQVDWGKGSKHKGKTVMVEYTDPNPFKEFHIGHLMSNALGESIARLVEYAGAKVIRANYQGDVGPHVAKAIWGKMQKPDASWGEAYVYGTEQYETHKEEIDAINKKVYAHDDEEINKLYDSGREASLAHFEKLYKMLGTKFDFYFFESETASKGLAIIKAHRDVFEESEGAIVFRGEKYGLHTRVFVTKLGLPTYEAKELGLVEAKKEKGNFDLSLTITANETSDYFRVVRKAAEMIFPDLEGKMVVRFHGMMRLSSGKMSSRKGNVITGESLLRSLQESARGREDVAVGAIKYAVLKSGSGKDIIFDPEKSLSLEGDSGPYIQYAHTRALSLLRGAKEASILPDTSDMPGEVNVLERLLIHFPHVVARAARELEPHYVTTYLTELASTFNSWYVNERVIGGSNPHYGVLLTQAVERTLSKGLDVLGISAPEEM